MSILLRYCILFVIVTLFCTFIFANTQSEEDTKEPYKIWVKATAYCPCAICCGTGSPGITKMGTSAKEPGVAVDPKLIPLGSHIDIPDYPRGPNDNGSWILCDDVGGKIKGKHIDVRFDSHEKAKQWGVRYLQIRVHEK